MEASGAPPRTLTWEAMEQIRYDYYYFCFEYIVYYIWLKIKAV